MEIKNLRKVDNFGKVKAFFSVEWPGKMTINDMKLVEGRNGLFASSPSKEYTDKNGQKKYQSIVYIEQDLLDRISKAAMAAYAPDKSAEPDIPF